MFVLCPRCELNYIEEEEEFCKICKAEMGLIDPNEVFMPEDDEVSEGKLCPICKINYIEDDEEMCLMCKREKDTVGCGVWASHCGGFSCGRAWTLGWLSSCHTQALKCVGFRSTVQGLGGRGVWALECRLSGCSAWA